MNGLLLPPKIVAMESLVWESKSGRFCDSLRYYKEMFYYNTSICFSISAFLSVIS